jgi:hypothetical protein
MHFLDSTTAVIPPMDGDNVPGQYHKQRLAGATTVEDVTQKLAKGRHYLFIAVTDVRLSFRHTLVVAGGAVTVTSFFLPAGAVYPFKAILGPDENYGSLFVHAGSPDDTAAYEAFVVHADR